MDCLRVIAAGFARPARARRRVPLWTIVAAATLMAAPAANAFTIGVGDKPGVAVDAAGTAYIAWNGPENAQNSSALQFCRLPRAASACDAGVGNPVCPRCRARA